MSRDIDPKYVNYEGNSEYGTGPDGYKYNREGGMTYDSKVQKNRAEAYARQQQEQQQRNREEERKRRQQEQQRSYSSGYSGPSFSFLDLLMGAGGLALPFIFNGVVVLILAVLGKIFSPVMPLFKLIWELFWMFLTCWIRVLKIWFTGPKYDTFFPTLRIRWVFPVEMAIAVYFLLRTLFRSIRGEYGYDEDQRNMTPLIVFPILELLHSFITIGTYNTYGHWLSIANGLFLGLQLLMFMGWIIRGVDSIRYR